MFEVITKDKNSQARVGRLKTNHGLVETPAYIIVGTNAQVRTLNREELNKTDIQIIIANTYHLWQEFGDDKLAKFEGLHSYMNWPKSLMTDSGGFQVFSLGYAREFGGSKVEQLTASKQQAKSKNLVRVNDDGVYFKVNDREEFLDAKKSIKIQQQLGADIILAFDEPSSPHHDKSYTKKAMIRTHDWAKRSIKAHTSKQQLFGIVQGGVYPDLREESAKYIDSLSFDGYSLGGAFGSSFGSKPEDTFREIDWMMPHLNQDKPRHLLGIGRVKDVFIGVAKGIDMFDCVIPTREARHGKLYTKTGEINIKNSQYTNDESLIESGCRCLTCSEYKVSRAKLRKLFKAKSDKAGKYATIHNIYFFNQMMAEIRQSLVEDKFSNLKKKYFQFY